MKKRSRRREEEEVGKKKEREMFGLIMRMMLKCRLI